jgi:hypothetical protein
MALTPEQSATLKAYIDNVPALAAYPLSGDGYFDLAHRLNTEIVTPDFYVWRENVTLDEIVNNGFAWVEVDNLTIGKARIWEWLFDLDGSINPAKPNVRAGIAECWSGNAARNAVQATVFVHCMAKATHVQRCFAAASATPPAVSGTLGASTNVATAVVTGVTPFEVEQARTS